MSSTHPFAAGVADTFRALAQPPKLYTETQEAMAELKGTIGRINGLLEDPKNFVSLAVEGAVAGVSSGKKNSEEGSLSLYDRVRLIALNGVSQGSVAVLKLLLENCTTYDLDTDDADLKERALKTLQKAQEENKSLQETAARVWIILKKYHIMFAGFTANISVSSNEEMSEFRKQFDSPNNDGLQPTLSSGQCQEKWRALFYRYNLPQAPDLVSEIPTPSSTFVHHSPSVEEMERIRQLEIKTNEKISSFKQKTVHIITMHTIHYLFKLEQTDDTAKFNQILEESEIDYDNIKQHYLERFGKKGARYYFYGLMYNLIFWLIWPIVSDAIDQVVVKIRTFWSNNLEVRTFTELKISLLSDYFGKIEKARRSYLKDNNPASPGTFSGFLEKNLQDFDGYTEDELLDIFNDYFVQNFVKAPSINIKGVRIPLISALLEWILHSIRKGIVRSVLKKTKIVDQLFTQGTQSVNHAQLGLKKMLSDKLRQIQGMLDRQIAESDLSEGESTFKKSDLKEKSSRLITSSLHNTIHEFSQKLLRFIDIEACGGDDRMLANLDNPVSGLVEQTMQAMSSLLNWEPFSLKKVLEDASTDLMETALLSIMEGTGEQIETQLSNIFEVLDKSFTYVPAEKREEMEINFRSESSIVDQNLNLLMEELARSALVFAVKTYLKTVAGEQHKRIKEYVKSEQNHLREFYKELNQRQEKLNAILKEPYECNLDKWHTKQIKAELGHIVFIVDKYLQHMTMQWRHSDFEACYSDVRGDLYNIYACVIQSLTLLSETVGSMAADLENMIKNEEDLIQTQECAKYLKLIYLEWDSEIAKEKLAELKAKLPSSIKEEVSIIIEALLPDYEEYEGVAFSLKNLNQFSDVQSRHERLTRKMAVLDEIEEKLKALSLLSQEYHDLRINRKFPTKADLERERQRLGHEVSQLYKEIMETENSMVQKYIAPLLESADTEELYNKLHASFFRSQIPIFSIIDQRKRYHQKMHDLYTEELAQMRELESRRESICDRKVELQASMKSHWDNIIIKIKNNAEAKTAEIVKKAADIERKLEERFEPCLMELKYFKSQFGVKGCITVGEMPLYSNAASKLLTPITQKIIQDTRSIIAAAGKPLHFEQLSLRILFVDIAKSMSEKK